MNSDGPHRRAPSFRINFFKRSLHSHGVSKPDELTATAPTTRIPITDGIHGVSDLHGIQRDVSPTGTRQFFRSRTPTALNDEFSFSSRQRSETSHSMPSEINSNLQKAGDIDFTSRSKSPGTRLKSAFGLLRKRSNPNLGRSMVSPIGERDEVEQNIGPFNEPLLDIDSVEPGNMAPRTHTPQSARSRGFESRPRGFKIGLSARSNTPRNVLTKPPPTNHARDRPRRATIPDTGMSYHSAMGDVYSSRTSRSSEPDLVLEDHGNDSIFSRESPAIGINGGSPAGGGGLFPRPASLQRHWSESGSHQRESVHRIQPNSRVSYVVRQRQSTERIRPVSFGGISPNTSHALQADPVQETLSVRSTSHRYADSSNTNHQTEQSQAMEVNAIEPSTNRNTASTLRPLLHDQDFAGSTSGISSSEFVQREEYNKLVEILKQERKLRKKLESQVAVLQEQVACLLHRHLVAVTGVSSSSEVRQNYQSDPKIDIQTSNEEIPTPEMTPPSTAPAGLSNTFQEFTGVPNSNQYSDSESDLEDDGGVTDIWATPAEENPSKDETNATSEQSVLLAPRPRSMNGRTMSLSQLTHKTNNVPE